MSEREGPSILTGITEVGLLFLAILGIVYWSIIVYFARKQKNRSLDQPEEREGMKAFYGLAVFGLVVNVLFAFSICSAFFVRLYTKNATSSRRNLLDPGSTDYSPLLLTTITWIYVFLAIISGRMATYVRSNSNDLKTGPNPFGSKFVNTLYSFSIAITIIYLLVVAIIVLTVLFRKNIALDNEEKSKSVFDTTNNFFLEWLVYPFIDNPVISWLLVALVLFVTALIVILVGLDQFHVRRSNINSGNDDEARKTKNRIAALVTCGTLLLVASFVALYSVFFNSSYKSVGRLILDRNTKMSLSNIKYVRPIYYEREGNELGSTTYATYYKNIPPTRLLYLKDGVYVAVNDEIERISGHLYKVIPLGMHIDCQDIKNKDNDLKTISNICGTDISSFIQNKEIINQEIKIFESSEGGEGKVLPFQHLERLGATKTAAGEVKFKGEGGLRAALKEIIKQAKQEAAVAQGLLDGAGTTSEG